MAFVPTVAQVAALKAIRAKGVFYSGNGISRATVKVLAREELIALEWTIETWWNPRSGLNHSVAHWVAKPVD
jgi:hypothetical protein